MTPYITIVAEADYKKDWKIKRKISIERFRFEFAKYCKLEK